MDPTASKTDYAIAQPASAASSVPQHPPNPPQPAMAGIQNDDERLLARIGYNQVRPPP